MVSNPSLHPAYFETHFECDEVIEDWPAEFAIITAYATTGEKWSDSSNQAADARLHSQLRQSHRWVRRLTGYSPATCHAEPGWAVALSFEDACDCGREFRQDAIYYVTADTLFVSLCGKDRAKTAVGPFRARVRVRPSD